MSGTNVNASDAMLRRYETELQEARVFTNGILERANTAQRDLTDEEKQHLADTSARMTAIRGQVDQVEEIQRVGAEVTGRLRTIDTAISTARGKAPTGEIVYRSAGAYMLDAYRAHMGSVDAKDRMEMFMREAEQTTTADVPGAIPTPIIGDVLNFIDSARPIVSLLGPRPLPSETWSRPKVSQHTSVALQGSGGLPADQGTELTSQKLTISKLNIEAATYGGYLNVPRQTIDFTQPGALDIIINDLAAQYSIETEAAAGVALNAVATSAVHYSELDQNTVSTALWAAAANVFTACRGQGKLVLFIAPDRLQVFGPLFTAYAPQNQQGEGFLASRFGQGVMGTISGIDTVMSAGVPSGKSFLTSTAAVEVYEQRVGTLQAVEPSVLGIQIAYAGYFAAKVVEAGGVVPVTYNGS